MKQPNRETSINWTPDMLSRFKRAYGMAVRTNQTEFEFDGNQFVSSYAKYLIEYLEFQFNTKQTPIAYHAEL